MSLKLIRVILSRSRNKIAFIIDYELSHLLNLHKLYRFDVYNISVYEKKARNNLLLFWHKKVSFCCFLKIARKTLSYGVSFFDGLSECDVFAGLRQ